MVAFFVAHVISRQTECLTDTSSKDDIIIPPQTESEAIVPHDNPRPPVLPRRSNRVSRPPDRYVPHW